MHRSLALCCVVAVNFIAGCDSGPNTHPVSGQVTIDGQPAPEQTRVNFHPVSEDVQLASGIVDANGNYTLYSGSEGTAGAMAGTYKIYLSPDPSSEDYMSGTPSGAPGGPSLGPIPKEYSSAATTPLEVEVTAGENKIDIEI